MPDLKLRDAVESADAKRTSPPHASVTQLPRYPRSTRCDGVVLKRWLAWSGGASAWLGALTVLAIALVLVVLDLTVGPVHRYWSRHSFTSSVLSGLLVLLLTVLIADRVTRFRQLRNQSRAIAAQAAAIVADARRAADTISSPAVQGRVGASARFRRGGRFP